MSDSATDLSSIVREAMHELMVDCQNVNREIVLESVCRCGSC
jgi:hypothetical protein